MLKLLFCVFPILSTVLIFETTTSDSISQSNERIASDELIDIRDGETYKTIMIGEKRWFAENLRYDVPEVVTTLDCVDTILSLEKLKHYGRLYDWGTLMNQNPVSESEANLASSKKFLQGICPKDWHVPSDEEWKALEKFLGMEEETIELMSIKRRIPNIQNVVSSADWISDKNALSESLLNIFPTGKYTSKKSKGIPAGFRHLGERATFWTATESSAETVWGRTIKYNESAISRYDKYPKKMGYSCRCVED